MRMKSAWNRRFALCRDELPHQYGHGRDDLTPSLPGFACGRLNYRATLQDVSNLELCRVHEPSQDPPPVSSIGWVSEAREVEELGDGRINSADPASTPPGWSGA
jgi:hypothetical protein